MEIFGKNYELLMEHLQVIDNKLLIMAPAAATIDSSVIQEDTLKAEEDEELYVNHIRNDNT